MVICPVSVLLPMKSLYSHYIYVSQDHSHLQAQAFQNKILECNYLHYG